MDYNDNELLFYIDEGDEFALKVLFIKYIPLIRKRIYTFNIKSMYKDDYLQEGYLVLFHSIKLYQRESRMTFNKYFDMVLQRKFITLLRTNKNYFENVVTVDDEYLETVIYEKLIEYEDNHREYEFNTTNLSKFEKNVFELYLAGYKSREIASKLNADSKKVYNAMYSLKKKI